MENEPPVYALRVSAYAERAIDSAVVFVCDNCGKAGNEAEDYARAFRRGLFGTIGGLATLPQRFPVAADTASMDAPPVRAAIYHHKPGSPAWRILYRVRKADNNEAAFVEIVTVRHGAQKPLTQAEGRDIDAANR